MTDNDSEEPRGASGMFSSVPARIGRYRQQAAYFTRLAETERVVRIRDQWENLARDYASLANTLGDHSDQTLSAAFSQLDVVERSLLPNQHSATPTPSASEPIHKVVESEESVVIPSLAPASLLRGAECGSRNTPCCRSPWFALPE